MRDIAERVVTKKDDNIHELRARFPNGLHFVVGDLHGEVRTLRKLMNKIEFDPYKDHVYFVGDYNEGGNVTALLNYMSEYYQENNNVPGFHMIRGNHERELWPVFPLDNIPDILVVRGRKLVFYIVHAGMVSIAFDLINEDMKENPNRKVYAYRLANNTCCEDAPLRQIVWSRKGLYSQHSHWHVWPNEKQLIEHNACIIHGHSPYCFFKHPDRFSYGDDNLFWHYQHVWYCKELRSFNIDSNAKGRHEHGETYRGLACICLEVYDELAEGNDGSLTTDLILNAENGLFGAELEYSGWTNEIKSPDRILNATPEMKTICFDGVNLYIGNG